MMDPITITLVQQEQHRDRLKRLEQEQLIWAAGLSQPGLGKLLFPIIDWFGQRRVTWGLKLQPSTPGLAGCCVQCGPQDCNPAHISA